MKSFVSACLILISTLAPPVFGAFKAATHKPLDVEHSKRTQTLFKTKWGYDRLIPYLQLPKRVQDKYRKIFPLDAVGVVHSEVKPFRTTAQYVGKHNGKYLFVIAQHIGDFKVPYEVELGHLSGRVFSVPLNRKSLFSTAEGDMAIYMAEDHLSPEIESRLDSTTPIKPLFATPEAIYHHDRNPFLFTAGRMIYPATIESIDKYPKTWNKKAADMWRNALPESNDNLDRRPDVKNRVGDIYVYAQTRLVGTEGLLRDPDGLIPGSKLPGDPFEASDVNKAPNSQAFTDTAGPRTSGKPYFYVDNRDHSPYSISTAWTSGMFQDIIQFLKDVKKDPSKTTGEVVVVKDEKDQLRLQIPRVEGAAPLAYGASLKTAGDMLRLKVLNYANDLSDQERGALQSYLNLGIQNTLKVFGR